MTLDDDATDRNIESVPPVPSDEVDVVGPERQQIDPSPDDIFQVLSSAIVDGGGAIESINLAVLAQMRGPLPPPQIVREYDATIPDGANRIMVMAETGQEATVAAGRRSQNHTFIIVLSIVVGGFILLLQGQEITGSIFSSVGLVAVVYALLRKGN